MTNRFLWTKLRLHHNSSEGFINCILIICLEGKTLDLYMFDRFSRS